MCEDVSELPPDWHLDDKWLAYDLAEREGPPPREEEGGCQGVKERTRIVLTLGYSSLAYLSRSRR